jgi:hypothetical protein
MNRASFPLIFGLLGLLIQTQAFGIQGTRTKGVGNYLQETHEEYTYLQETHEEYTYPQCQQFNSEEEKTYSVTCEEGQYSYHPIDTSFSAHLDGLRKPTGALIVSREKYVLLTELRKFVLEKLKQRTLYLSDIEDCFVFHMNDPSSVTELCKNQVEVMRKTTREAYPLLRKNMAIMEGVSSDGEIDPDIEHPQEMHEVQPLSEEEKANVEGILKETLGQERATYQNNFNDRYNCPRPGDERRPTRFCRDRIRDHTSRHMTQFREKLKKQAKENYETILGEAPFLAFVDLPKIGDGPVGADVAVMGALKTMSEHSLNQYMELKKKRPFEFKEFFKHPKIIEEFMATRKNPPGQFMCDAYQDYHNMYGPGGTQEIMTTVGIATMALVGGGLCAMTAGLGCAVAVAIGTEAMAIGNSQIDLNDTIALSRSGLATRQEVEEAQDRRNTDLLLAPLSFVGLKAGRTLANTEKAVVRGGASTVGKNFFESYLKFNPTTATDNALWIARARSSTTGLFFDVENAALKRLNDTLGDKNLVTALTNLHKDILFKKMDALKLKYPNLDILKYSDFKSSRFSFGGEIPPGLQDELTQIFNEANEEFASRVARNKEISIPESENPITWFNGGVGASADQAGLAARHARQSPRGGLQILHMDNVREQVQTSMRAIENQRRRVQGFLRDHPQLLEGEAGKQIPSTEVFEVLRKAKDASPKELAKIFKTRFNATLTPDHAADLLDYSKNVDQFSPGIWIESRVVANLDEASHGGFSVDFKGMGARNVSQVAKDLVASGDDVDLAIRTIREGEGVVTQQFDEAKDGFQNLVSQTLEDLKIPVKTECSGDDCVSIPAAVLPDVAKEKMMTAISRTENPSGYRLSFIPPNIVPKDRSVVAVHGELVEKKVRKVLTGFGDSLIPPSVLDRVTFALDMPSSLGRGEVRLLVKPADGIQLSDSEKRLIEESLAPSISKVNKEIAEETGQAINYNSAGVSFY